MMPLDPSLEKSTRPSLRHEITTQSSHLDAEIEIPPYSHRESCTTHSSTFTHAVSKLHSPTLSKSVSPFAKSHPTTTLF